MKQENTLWVEKYRPDTLEGYIGNDVIVGKMKTYIEGGDIPHLLLYGRAGAAIFNQFRDQLSRNFMIEHPEMGPFIEMLVYTQIQFVHQIPPCTLFLQLYH